MRLQCQTKTKCAALSATSCWHCFATSFNNENIKYDELIVGQTEFRWKKKKWYASIEARSSANWKRKKFEYIIYFSVAWSFYPVRHFQIHVAIIFAIDVSSNMWFVLAEMTRIANSQIIFFSYLRSVANFYSDGWILLFLYEFHFGCTLFFLSLIVQKYY